MVYLFLMDFRKTNRRNILAMSGAIFASGLTAALPVRALPRPIQFGLVADLALENRVLKKSIIADEGDQE